MPRTDSQNAAIRAESRSRILAAALRLFARHGYEQTSVRQIAQEAGIAQGLLYNYFSGKEQLLLAIFEQSIADVLESFAQAEAAGPADQRVERLIRASFAILRRNREFWALSYHVRMQVGVIAGLAERVEAWTSSIRGRLQRYLHEAGVAQPEVEAVILFALIDGIAQHYVLNPERYPLDLIIETIVRKYQ
jgi:AcrR family transcriptional regulator